MAHDSGSLAQLNLVLAHFGKRQWFFWHSSNDVPNKKNVDKRLGTDETSLFSWFFSRKAGMEAALYLLARRLSHKIVWDANKVGNKAQHKAALYRSYKIRAKNKVGNF